MLPAFVVQPLIYDIPYKSATQGTMPGIQLTGTKKTFTPV